MTVGLAQSIPSQKLNKYQGKIKGHVGVTEDEKCGYTFCNLDGNSVVKKFRNLICRVRELFRRFGFFL